MLRQLWPSCWPLSVSNLVSHQVAVGLSALPDVGRVIHPGSLPAGDAAQPAVGVQGPRYCQHINGQGSAQQAGSRAGVLSGCRPFSTSSPDGSQQHTHQSSADQELANQLLEGGLKHVAKQGWTSSALEAAAHDLGLSPAVLGILPRRESQLVEHYIASCNARLAQELASMQASGQFEHLRTKERLALALRTRLSMLEPYMSSWPQALAILSRPTNMPHALRLLYELVDEVWVAVGDKSTDTSWYTKRAMLAGVYSATELYMLTDYSPGYEDTWQALDRRLEEAIQLGRWASKLNHAVYGAWQQAMKQAASDARKAGMAPGA